MIIIKNKEDIEKYFNKKTQFYEFNDNVDIQCDIVFNKNISAYDIYAEYIKAKKIWARTIKVFTIVADEVKAFNIDADKIYVENVDINNISTDIIAAADIKTADIKASDIYAQKMLNSAGSIKAYNEIVAKHIRYYDVCVAYNDIMCESIKGKLKNAKHFSLDGKIIITKEED